MRMKYIEARVCPGRIQAFVCHCGLELQMNSLHSKHLKYKHFDCELYNYHPYANENSLVMIT